MIPVYVISLKTSFDRREFMRAQFQQLGIPFEFMDAIDGRRLDSAELAKLAPEGGLDFSGVMTAGEIGCALSHLTAIRRIAQCSQPYAAVFEDDVTVAKEARKFLEESYLNSLPNFDILQLDGTAPHRRRLAFKVGDADHHELCALTKPHHSVYALIYNRDAAEKITRTIPIIRATIDNMLFYDCRVSGLRVIAARPSVATHHGLPSVIGERASIDNINQKIGREVRRFQSWCRRWNSFARAWGLQGVLRLRLRRTGRLHQAMTHIIRIS